MIARLLALLVLAGSWLVVLWWLILPDFAGWTVPQLAAMHAFPPLFVWGGWLFWRRRRLSAETAAFAEREAQAEAERQEKLAAALLAHASEVEHLRFACDCRGVALSQVLVSAEFAEPLLPEDDAIHFSSLVDDEEREPAEAMLEQLRPGLVEAMTTLYAGCPAAAAFPIYVRPPADAVGEEVLACLREIRAKLVAEAGLPARPESFSRVLFLPARESAAESVLSLFEADPGLPGALVVAFDSPWWLQRVQGDDWEVSPEKQERRKWLGAPGQGVAAMFVTSPRLNEALETLRPSRPGEYDAMTPYWEKALNGTGGTAFLSALSEAELESLQRARPLVRIHRAASRDFGPQPPRSMEFARSMQMLIERAQIQAGLVELPFEAAPSDAEAAPAGGGCDWLIHNAGDVDRAGNRLAALGVALYNRGIDLDPIGAATNVTVRAGDLGQVRGLAMLGMAVARAVERGGHCLCAEFSGDSRLALYFAAPVGDPA